MNIEQASEQLQEQDRLTADAGSDEYFRKVFAPTPGESDQAAIARIRKELKDCNPLEAA